MPDVLTPGKALSMYRLGAPVDPGREMEVGGVKAEWGDHPILCRPPGIMTWLSLVAGPPLALTD